MCTSRIWDRRRRWEGRSCTKEESHKKLDRWDGDDVLGASGQKSRDDQVGSGQFIGEQETDEFIYTNRPEGRDDEPQATRIQRVGDQLLAQPSWWFLWRKPFSSLPSPGK